MRFLLLHIIFLLSCSFATYAQINIWEAQKDSPKVELTPYLVPGTGNRAIVICPGGSYFWHASETEGHAVARWLQKNGIASFVLNYRVANFPAFIVPYRYFFRGNRYPDAQNDLKQAMRLIKDKAETFRVDREKVGVMGFSAGGHLVVSSGILFEKPDRPAFIAALYPVVTMEKDCVHKRSRRALLGEDRLSDEKIKHLLSLENNIPDDCPPVFLVNCKDDPVVKYQNSLLLDSALTSKNINHTYILYNTGGHGFGVDPKKGTQECRQWKNEFLRWINRVLP